MIPTAKQIQDSKDANAKADAWVSEERAKRYAAAPTCWHCGDKIMEAAIFHKNECYHCEQDLLNDF